MAKRREKNSGEFYKSVIRKQSKVIKELKKKAGRADKIKNQVEDLEVELAERLLEEDMQDNIVYDDDACSNCNKGKLEKISLGPKSIVVCDNCSYRKVIK